jgi:hypothetical protein
MTDEELVDRIIGCIKQRLPESDSLDLQIDLKYQT